ncbi:MAG: hypothetical protein ACXWC6_07505 [Ramlibacter sp.]
MRPSAVAFSLLAALVLTSGAAHSQSEPPAFGIKEPEPRVGSNIRKYVSRGSMLPINRRYDQLTAEEKAHLLAVYESMGPDDEPPFPAEGLRPIHEAIQKAQQSLLVRGDLLMFATVGADGNVAEVKTIRSPDAQMAAVAAKVLFLTRFKPALCKGQPCRMDYPFSFHFRVD